MKLRTLADARELIDKHLPADYRQRDTWQLVAKCLDEAPAAIALRLALMLEGVTCRPL